MNDSDEYVQKYSGINYRFDDFNIVKLDFT